MAEMQQLQQQVEAQQQELQQYADSDPETLAAMDLATRVRSAAHAMMVLVCHTQ